MKNPSFSTGLASVDKRIGLGFAGALLILAAIDGISYLSIENLITNSTSIAHTRRIINQVDALTVAIADAGSAARGYVIAGTQNHLERYDHAYDEIQRTLSDLRALTRDNPRQQLRLGAIAAPLADTLAFYQRIIGLNEGGQHADAADMVLSAQEEALNTGLRKQLLDIKSEETSLLLQSTDSADSSARQSTVALIGGSLLSILILSLVFRHLHREVATRKRSEEGLAQLGAQLQIANQRLERSNDELARASRLKSDFLSSMSHEFRTPLNAITGYSELLAEDATGPLSERQRRFVGHIQRGAKHLLDLINDILDLSKIEAGKIEMHPERVTVRETLFEVIAAIRPLAIAKSIEIDCRVPEHDAVYADRLRFKQIAFNLLSNALKFTPAKGSVWIESSIEGRMMTISVCDTGSGIPTHEHESIFENFYQAGASTKGLREGTGLGLAIVKRLVMLQGGTIRVESEPGAGSRFRFELPVAEVLPENQEEQANATPGGAGSSAVPLILVVDDDPGASGPLISYLEETGFGTVSARPGRGASLMAAKVQPAIVLLNLRTDGMAGWRTLCELKAHTATSAIPVIVISAEDGVQLGFTLGAAQPITRPLSREALAEIVRQHLPSRTDGPSAVLVVDDDLGTIEMASEVLRAAGYSPVTARSGREALAILAETPVDAVLLDLIMPEMDGFEVLRRIRDIRGLREIAIVVLTGKQLSDEDVEILHSQSAAFIQKGTSWKEALLPELRKAIQLQSSGRDNDGQNG
ncbi:MAG TPA: response regulator [Bryobacteraceae bacterium]|jgi:signal transduction histidine kinase/DNA-binding response OmpR family regulator